MNCLKSSLELLPLVGELVYTVGVGGGKWGSVVFFAEQINLVRRLVIKGNLELMFLGEFQHAIDDKGRLTIPAKFREELAGGAVVTRGFEKYLLLYTTESFTRLTVRAKNLSPTDPENRALLRLAFSGASEAALDKQGRIHVPPFLRTYAGLTGECVIVGVGDYIEIWSRDGWDEQLKVVNDPEVNARRFATLNLATGQEQAAPTVLQIVPAPATAPASVPAPAPSAEVKPVEPASTASE